MMRTMVVVTEAVIAMPGTAGGRVALLNATRCYIQYTSRYRPSHTTSTKCQYHATPSKPKW